MIVLVIPTVALIVVAVVLVGILAWDTVTISMVVEVEAVVIGMLTNVEIIVAGAIVIVLKFALSV